MKKFLFNFLISSVFLMAVSSIQSEANYLKVYTHCDPAVITGPGVSFRHCYEYEIVYIGTGYWMDIKREWYEPVQLD